MADVKDAELVNYIETVALYNFLESEGTMYLWKTLLVTLRMNLFPNKCSENDFCQVQGLKDLERDCDQ